MEAICNRAALLEALQVTSAAITPRTPKPALQCVLVDCQKEGLTLVATDLQVGIRAGHHVCLYIQFLGQALTVHDTDDVIGDFRDLVGVVIVVGANNRNELIYTKAIVQPTATQTFDLARCLGEIHRRCAGYPDWGQRYAN